MSQSSAEGEELCVATAEDQRAVVDMCGDVYNGVDYLPHAFVHLVTGDGVKGFLYKVKGELVSFCSAQVIDGGQSLIFVGSRVKPGFQDRGIYGRFRKQIFEHFKDKELYPHLRYDVAIIHTLRKRTYSGRMRDDSWRLLSTRNDHTPVFDASNLHKLPAPQTSIYNVRKLTTDSVLELLQATPSDWLHLFPEHRIIACFKAYRIMPENLHFILDKNVHTALLVSTKSTSPKRYSILSAGTYHPCELGISYQLDIYGQGEEEELKEHLHAHLQRLRDISESLTDKVVFHVFYHERVDDIVAEVTSPLSAYKLELLSKMYERVYLLERDITEI